MSTQSNGYVSLDSVFTTKTHLVVKYFKSVVSMQVSSSLPLLAGYYISWCVTAVS